MTTGVTLTPVRAPGAGLLIAVATAAIFASASLLFALQPLFAKLALPLLGGSPAVWTTALAFYQAALVAGYLYADRLQRLGRLGLQAGVHGVVLLAAAVIALPLSVSTLLGAPPSGAPTLWFLGVLTVSIGAPFIALSATAPLVQAWVARGAPGVDPYPLYAASNLGSFASLLAYPLLIEPAFGGQAQAMGWSVGFGLGALLILGAGVIAARQPAAASAVAAPVAQAPRPDVATRWRERAIWAASAFAPSLLLAGVTVHISTDVAAVPLLWAAPLALYLLTFVIAFASRPIVSPGLMFIARLALVFALAALAAGDARVSFIGWVEDLALHLTAFFVATLACHLELARRKPEPARLTDFYLWMSVGGALGGAFAGLVAPAIFNAVHEYPLALVACLLVAPWGKLDAERLWSGVILATLVIVVVGGLVLAERLTPQVLFNSMAPILVAAAIGLGLVAFRSRDSAPMVAALAACAFLLKPVFDPTQGVRLTERSFFGVHRVRDTPDWRLLTHGTTLHGVKSLDPARTFTPLAYYAPPTPIGSAIRMTGEIRPNATIGIVGLGSGATACLARPGQTWTFFEIDPDIVDIAQRPGLFDFVRTCTPKARIILGDARLTLGQEPDGSYDLILVDAFSSATIPAHLLTREAIALYRSKLKPGGVVLMHVSNRYLALVGPLGDIAAADDIPALVANHFPAYNRDDPKRAYDISASTVVALGADESAILPYSIDPMWETFEGPGRRLWTDDYQNVVGAILAKRRDEQ